MNEFLPVSRREMSDRGWDQADFVCVTGDAYVDHPSFGIAIISRLLESQGFRVAVLAQPEFSHAGDFKRFSRPKYAFLINGGNIDSMVAHYTAAKRRRSDDAYTPGNKAGRRPDRAVTVYSRLAKEAYPDCPVIIGGIEASLRRFAHYDYWDDAVRPSILMDSGADLLVYGMGERQITAIARVLSQGGSPRDLWGERGICYLCAPEEGPADGVVCPSFYRVSQDKEAYARASRIQMEEQDAVYGRTIIQKQSPTQTLVQTPPAPPLEQEDLDRVFDLPFQRMYHPSYEKEGGVKAIEEVEFSIMHNRGCFGGCHFCAITLHQGRRVTCRSHESVLREARAFVKNPRFKGYIHDVGGPTANFRGPSCPKQVKAGVCKDRLCLAPKPCPAIQADHSDYLELLRQLREIKGVKKVFIRSGIRFDYLNLDTKTDFMDQLVRHHVSGQLKVAPEHTSPRVLAMMGKPPIQSFERFMKNFYAATKRAGKEQYLVPYLMSSHPGSRLSDAVELACFLKNHNMRPEQVQDFYPTPGTISTTMFYTGLDPATMEPVYVPRTPQEKRMQRILLQYYKPENRREVIQALLAAGRPDLIGTGPHCLVPPDRQYVQAQRQRQETRGAGRGTGNAPAGRRGGRAGSPPSKPAARKRGRR